MSEYRDLIYYKDDIIKAYSDKRKNLKKEDVEDLLKCALLFLGKTLKNKNTIAFEVPNIGFLHKKINFSNLEEMDSSVKKEDILFIETLYLNTKYSPIITRTDIIEQNYLGINREELQNIQNIQNNK